MRRRFPVVLLLHDSSTPMSPVGEILSCILVLYVFRLVSANPHHIDTFNQVAIHLDMDDFVLLREPIELVWRINFIRLISITLVKRSIDLLKSFDCLKKFHTHITEELEMQVEKL